MRFFVSILLACVLFACADLKKTDQLNRVNNLYDNVDSLLIVSNQINDAQLMEEIEESKTLIWDLTILAKDDTIIETDARLIDKHSNYVSKLSYLKIRIEKLKNTLEEQKSAIRNLTKDIKNGSGKRDLYDENLEFEQKKVYLIEKELNSIKTKKLTILDKIAILKTKSRELIKKLESKQKTR